MIDLSHVSLGLTPEFECSYLEQQSERLLVVYPLEQASAPLYEELMNKGFRRSGDQVYRPNCPQCQACQSLRIKVNDFKPTTSQRRIINKNKDIEFKVSHQEKSQYFDLYSRYISQRHRTGSMYPPTIETMQSFSQCHWLDIIFIEGYLDGQLVSVAVCDLLSNSLSAVYTFFAPEFDKRSLGKLNILQQIEIAKQLEREFVYLGFQIDECTAMNYKQNYVPNERFINNQWIKVKK
ncbi:arginyltransferase [Psychrobium sp. 1_MG-2023]|uniref:arginyltransferase n=1 Tax=Psychrobium sp. 1_MG-2023 TaxID=3062624 RepID=UPI000C325EFA|nr:arginyltransferase [Psychrobium sp. 1_MG-2023]MDP2561873.1 arginyltransferase [Psychrobium sp. 1_MG-2023]PKF59712.1 arginyltransferase [Alteromonadales bacterium alter-6D02]